MELFDHDARARERGVDLLDERRVLQQRREPVRRSSAPRHRVVDPVERHELDLRGGADLQPFGLGGRLFPAERTARAERERLAVLVGQLGRRPRDTVPEVRHRVEVGPQPHVPDGSEVGGEGDAVVDAEDHPDRRCPEPGGVEHRRPIERDLLGAEHPGAIHERAA